MVRNTQSRQRDVEGHFSPENGQPVLHKHTKLSLTDMEISNKADEPIVDLKINNPLHKIIDILDQIKRHQATTFTLRFTIPLIALPIFLFAAFQLGRAQVACVPVFASQVGSIHSLKVLTPKEEPTLWNTLLAFLPKLPSIVPPNELQDNTRIILIKNDVEAITVVKANDVDISSYEGHRVVVTGNFSGCTSSITLDSPKNIVNL